MVKILLTSTNHLQVKAYRSSRLTWSLLARRRRRKLVSGEKHTTWTVQKHCCVNDKNSIWPCSQGLHKQEVHLFLVSVCSLPHSANSCSHRWQYPASHCNRQCPQTRVNIFATGIMNAAGIFWHEPSSGCKMLTTAVCSVRELRCQVNCIHPYTLQHTPPP